MNYMIMQVHAELKCLRTHIVDFLVYRLKHDLITEKYASMLAQSVLDNLTDTLTHDQIHQVLDKLSIDFPDLKPEIDSTSAACETASARNAVDQQVLEALSAGNLDQALAALDQYKVK